MIDPHRIILGSAQFGLPYGVASRKNQVSLEVAEEIIKLAHKRGITKLDTSPLYGSSEEVLGMIGIQDWKVITKIDIDKKSQVSIYNQVHISLEQSRSRLRVAKHYAALVHYPYLLNKDHLSQISEAFQDAKNLGLLSKIGFSIYEPKEIENYIDLRPDIIQAPMNVFDQSLIQTGWFDKLTAMGIEVHARSVLLQGLLTMEKNELSPFFDKFSHRFEKLEKMVKDSNTCRLQLLLGHLFNNPKLHNIIIGIHKANQLSEILDLDVSNLKPEDIYDLAATEAELKYPYNWL